jgi:hypothetical protein
VLARSSSNLLDWAEELLEAVFSLQSDPKLYRGQARTVVIEIRVVCVCVRAWACVCICEWRKG